MSQPGYNAAPITPTAYDDNNWKLWGDAKVDGGQSTPSMKISVVKNQPRYTVYTGRKDAKGQSESIWARMSPQAFYHWLALIERVAFSKTPLKLAMKNEKMIDDRNNPGKKKQITESTSIVWKDETGMIYIAVTAYNKPNIPFAMKPPRFHSLCDENGQPANIAITSALCAQEYVRIHRAMLPVILATNFDSTSQSVGNNYQKQGGNNYQKQGGGNNYNKPANNNNGNNWGKPTEAANDNRWGQPNDAANDDNSDDDSGDLSQAFSGMKF